MPAPGEIAEVSLTVTLGVEGSIAPEAHESV